MATPQFAVPIAAEDRFTAVFKQLDKQAEQVFGRLKKTGGEVTHAFEPFARLMGVSGVLSGLGLAGAIEGLQDFARAGQEVFRSSATIGIGADAIQNAGRKFFLAGGDARNAGTALDSLGQRLHGAAWGRDAEAIAVFKEFHVALRDGNGQIRKADQVMPELARKILALKDPYQQVELAQFAFGAGWLDVLAALRQDPRAFDDLNDKTKKAGRNWRDGGAAANDFSNATNNAADAVSGFAKRVAEDLFPKLQPATGEVAKLFDQMRESPAAIKAVEAALAALSVTAGGTLVSALAKLTVAMNTVWAAPFLRFLLSPAGAAASGVGAFLWGMWPKPAGNEAEVDAEKDLARKALEAAHPELKTKMPPPLGSRFRPHAAFRSPGAAIGNTIQHGVDFFMEKGLPREQAAGIVARLAAESGGGVRLDPNAVNPSSGAYGIAQWLGARKPAAVATRGDLDKQLDLVWQEFQTSEAASFARIRQATTAHDAATAMEGFERAGNPSFTAWAARVADKIFGIGAAEAAEPEAAPAPSPGEHRDTTTPAGTFRLPPGTRYNSRGMPYAPQIAADDAAVEQSMRAIRASQRSGRNWGDLPDTYGDWPAAADTEHHVKIDVNGPPGTRAAIVSGNGPATLGLKVGRAMGGP